MSVSWVLLVLGWISLGRRASEAESREAVVSVEGVVYVERGWKTLYVTSSGKICAESNEAHL